MNAAASISRLNELIAALDRRMPRAHRPGEADVVRDAAALRAGAVERISQLTVDLTLATRR